VAPTPPDFEVPRGACDCHVHIFGPPTRFPLSPERRYTPGEASVAQLRELQRALHLERVVVVQPSPYGTDNRCLLDALHTLGMQARGVAVIDDATTDAALEQLHAAGIQGVRLNLETGGLRDPAVARSLLERTAHSVAPLGWHVQLYTSLSILAALHETLLALPTLVVIDHFGLAHAAGGVAQPGFDRLLALVRSGKAYVKLSAAYHLSEADDYADLLPIARALIEANPERMLWGSDWPHTRSGHGPRDPAVVTPFRQEDDGRALNRLRRWAGDAATTRTILVDNPMRLYGF
jgi:predicted TIM-barrel fold metal-dependent hydrolase